MTFAKNRIAQEANNAMTERANTAQESLYRLLTLSSTLLSIQAPLCLVLKLSRHSRIHLFLGILALLCCILTSTIGYIHYVHTTNQKARRLGFAYRNYERIVAEDPVAGLADLLKGGSITWLYTCAIIGALALLLDLILLSLVAFQILFS
jgi:hypothetical protein